MRRQWNAKKLLAFVATCPPGTPVAFVEQIYATRLLGANYDFALHGGGNTSFKCTAPDLFGDPVETLFVKASGCDMAQASAGDFVCLDLAKLRRLDRDMELDDEAMAHFFSTATVRPHPRRPSIETLLHAFLPFVCVDHTHPAAVLALTNRNDAKQCVKKAFSTPVGFLPYAATGIGCGRAVAAAVRVMPECKGVIIGHHGLVTWGSAAAEAYRATVDLVTEAEAWLEKHRSRTIAVTHDAAAVGRAKERYRSLAPLIRGRLMPPSADDGGRRRGVSMAHLADKGLLSLLDAPEALSAAVSTPLTPDYIIRIGRLPLLIERPILDDGDRFRAQIAAACEVWRGDHDSFVKKYSGRQTVVRQTDGHLPRVVLIPGVGVVCAGPSAKDAAAAADITAQGLAVKRMIFETGGTYRDLDDSHCFDMEFRSYQRAKLPSDDATGALQGRIVLVTGAAGAIGSGLCASLIEKGCQVAIADLPGGALDALVNECVGRFGADRIVPVTMDVTDEASVHDGFGKIVERFGGLDAVVVNAGIAHVATLAAMKLEAFRRLERVNTEGTLLTMREAARIFTLQNCGGDIVLISTKNVFAPGASFGAYSATKAAAHQIARIAALELAGIDVRVNMVAPDAVFSHGAQKSGLWATVGPDRMKSRGLDQKGLEEYYRNRNLLKTKVTAAHVAAAVEFFLERLTPTTGATIPVDGGLPDATPR
ncbi:MAG: bifunctional aldolase/short-chain dehydrogenase [Chitinispirillaceae bacterium]|nr:bifunctional aldolase/short-chain dehydrogenase [Chitinispirillaceae bacterium]